MALYTIVFEWDGGTYIDQVRARSVDAAIETWVQELDTDPIAAFGPRLRERLASELKEERSAPLKGLTNTWCQSASMHGKLALVHVVQTESLPAFLTDELPGRSSRAPAVRNADSGRRSLDQGGSEEPRSGVCAAKIKMRSAERDSEADHRCAAPAMAIGR